MRRRKKGNDESSMELLLDTMCNTFGGIIFIAVSLIIISSSLSKEEPVNVTPEAVELEFKKQIAEQRKKMSKYSMNKNLYKEILSKVDKSTVSKQIKEVQKLEAEKLTLEMQNRDLERNAYDLKELDENVKYDIAKTQILLKDLDKKFLKLVEGSKHKDKKKIITELKEKSKEIKIQTWSFPRLARVSTKPYWLMIKNKKIYRVPDKRLSWFQNNNITPDVNYEIIKSNEKTGIEFFAKSGHHISKIDNLFKDVSPYSKFFEIYVDEKSFAELEILRKYIKSRGFKYHWTTVSLLKGTLTYYFVDKANYEAY